jgi:hypothetical protein
MPRQINASSLLLDAGSVGLSESAKAELTLVIEPTDPDVTLEGVDHVLDVIVAVLQELREATQSEDPALTLHTARVERTRTLFTVSLASRPSVANFSVKEPSLWDCFRAVDLETADTRLLRRLGSAYFMSAVAFARPSRAAIQSMLAAATATGTAEAPRAMLAMDQCTQAIWNKAAKKLAKRSGSHTSAASSLFEQRIEQRWVSGRSFTVAKKVKGAADSLTATEVIYTAQKVQSAAEDGSAVAFLIAFAHWIGLWLWELLSVEVFAPPGTGLIRLSPDCSSVHIDLRRVFADLAKARPKGAKRSTDVLILPLPLWMVLWLRALRPLRPDARTLAELTDTRLAKSHWRIPGVPPEHSKRLTAHRFVDSRSQPLIKHVNQHVLVFAHVDFQRAEKSSYNYQAVPQHDVVTMLRERSDALGWGPLCEVLMDHDLHLASRNTPLRTAVGELVTARGEALNRSAAGPNAGWERLVELHNNLVRYVLLVCTLAWLLRGRLSHAVPASIARLFEAFDYRDKVVPNARSAPAPLTCGIVLRRQLQYLVAHAAALADRGDRLIRKGRADIAPVVTTLRRLADADGDLELLQLIEGTTLRPAGAHDLAIGLPLEWCFSADALRHFSADAQRELGTTAAQIELLLRHVATGGELFSTGCGVALREWSIDAAAAQDRLLTSLGATALPGLVSIIGGGRR